MYDTIIMADFWCSFPNFNNGIWIIRSSIQKFLRLMFIKNIVEQFLMFDYV